MLFSLEHLGLTAEIDEFMVLDQHRGRGVGSALLRIAESTFIKAAAQASRSSCPGATIPPEPTTITRDIRKGQGTSFSTKRCRTANQPLQHWGRILLFRDILSRQRSELRSYGDQAGAVPCRKPGCGIHGDH